MEVIGEYECFHSKKKKKKKKKQVNAKYNFLLKISELYLRWWDLLTGGWLTLLILPYNKKALDIHLSRYTYTYMLINDLIVILLNIKKCEKNHFFLYSLHILASNISFILNIFQTVMTAANSSVVWLKMLFKTALYIFLLGCFTQPAVSISKWNKKDLP